MTNPQPAPPPPPDPPTAAPAAVPSALARGWLRDLLRGIRMDGVQPRDPRVKALWDLLRRRQLLARSTWVRTTLRHIWQQGLVQRHRPRTTTRMLALLRAWGVLRARPLLRHAPGAVPGSAAIRQFRRLQPVTLRRVASARPLQALRPIQPLGWRRGRR